MFENVDGGTDAGVIGILIAHLGAFCSGELKSEFTNSRICSIFVNNLIESKKRDCMKNFSTNSRESIHRYPYKTSQ